MDRPLSVFLVAVTIALAAGPAHARQNRQAVPANFTHAAFAEGLGSAGLGSLNYELGYRGDFGLRAGIGSWVFWISYPVTASYLIGGPRHNLEVGAGVTIIDFPDDPDADDHWLDGLFTGAGRNAIAVGNVIGGTASSARAGSSLEPF